MYIFHADNVYLSRVPVPALTLIPMKQCNMRVNWLAPYFNVSFRPPHPFSHRCLCLKTINISSSNKCIKTFFLWSDGKRSNSICPADIICFSSSYLTETSHSSRSNMSIWLCRQSCSAKWSPTSFLEVTVGIVDGVLFAVKVLLRPNLRDIFYQNVYHLLNLHDLTKVYRNCRLDKDKRLKILRCLPQRKKSGGHYSVQGQRLSVVTSANQLANVFSNK